MLSLEQAKNILNDPELTDDEVLEIRDHFYYLAELIFEKWKKDMSEKKNHEADGRI
jgi:hypothetical protein